MRRTYDDGWPVAPAPTMTRPPVGASVMTLPRRRTFNDSLYLCSSYIHCHNDTSVGIAGQAASGGIWYTWVCNGMVQ